MNKAFNTRIGAALVALSFSAFAGTAAADEGIATRTAVAVGHIIAAQGNAALVEIRRELKDALLEQVKPLLPKPAPEAQPAAPAPALARR